VKRAVFFDRDGVLNAAVVRDGRPYPPASDAELRIDDTARETIERLRASRFAIVVVTNQPDVARGTTTRDRVESINARIREALTIDDVYVCYHDNADACGCRKPKPGMLIAAAAEHGIALDRSYMVGDRWSDVVAGQAAGCKVVWIDRCYQEREPMSADARVTSLAHAGDWILDDSSRS